MTTNNYEFIATTLVGINSELYGIHYYYVYFLYLFRGWE